MGQHFCALSKKKTAPKSSASSKHEQQYRTVPGKYGTLRSTLGRSLLYHYNHPGDLVPRSCVADEIGHRCLTCLKSAAEWTGYEKDWMMSRLSSLNVHYLSLLITEQCSCVVAWLTVVQQYSTVLYLDSQLACWRLVRKYGTAEIMMHIIILSVPYGSKQTTKRNS